MHSMNEWVIHFSLSYITFLSMFSPPATMTAASSMLGDIPPPVLKRIAWKVACGYFIVMMISIWLGQWLLTALGLNTHALTITGGAALLFQGWPLMTRGTKAEQGKTPVEEVPADRFRQVSIVPLLFPLSVGGGTIAVGISLAARSGNWVDLLVLSLVILLMVPTVALTFLAIRPLHSRLSAGAQDIMARISGIVLVTLALQLLITGIVKMVLFVMGSPS